MESNPRWFELLCYAVAVGCVGFDVAFWTLGLPGSEHGRWADVVCTVLLLVAAWVSVVVGETARRVRTRSN